MAEQYIYAVARIRNKEQNLLSGSVMESLMAAKDVKECLRLLSDHGWNADDNADPEAMLTQERDKTWALISELVPDMSVFDVFLYANDYHNLKAGLKEAFVSRQSKTDHSSIYVRADQCTVDPELIRKACAERNFDALPEDMREVAKQANELLLHTGDGQLCDITVDRAALEKIYDAGKRTKNEILEQYAELTVASADIKTAIRANKTGKDRQFLDRALAPCDSLDLSMLAQAAADSVDAIYAYLERTVYAGAIPEIKLSPSAFERWCDNKIIESIRPQIHNPFTIGPLAAYILARENEIKTVRIILSGKMNALPQESVRERVREMYV